MQFEQIGITRFYTEAYHPASRLFHQLKQFKVYMLRTCGTVEGQTKIAFNHKFAEFNDPGTLQREEVIIVIYVSYPVIFMQVFDEIIHVFRRVVAE